MFLLSLNSGIMVGYALSSIFDYKTVGWIVVGLPILGTILSASILSETPQFLLRNKKEQEARESFKFYRNFKNANSKDKHDFEAEFESIKSSVTEALERDDKITLGDFSK